VSGFAALSGDLAFFQAVRVLKTPVSLADNFLDFPRSSR